MIISGFVLLAISTPGPVQRPATGVPPFSSKSSPSPGRWVGPASSEVDLAALLHGATTQELRQLTDDDIDHPSRRVRFGRRRQPTPLDPCTWSALQRSLDHRTTLGSNNSHVLITMQTKATRAPASDGYIKNNPA